MCYDASSQDVHDRTMMTTKANQLMQAIHGTDVYAGYSSVLFVDLQGWNGAHPAFSDIITKSRPAVIFDVGVWKGLSTVFMAKQLRENGIDGAIVAIDTFLGSPENWTRAEERKLIIWKHGRPLIYDQFLTNVTRTGFDDLIVPLAQTSENAAVILSDLGIRANLVH